MKLFRSIYEDLSKTIDTVESIKWYDWWDNQISVFEEDYGFPFPAAFFSVYLRDFDQVGKKVQSADAFIDVYVAVESLAEAHKGSKTQDKALIFADIMDQVNNAFDNTAGQTFSGLKLDDVSHMDSVPGIRLYRMTYKSTATIDTSEEVSLVEDPGLKDGEKSTDTPRDTNPPDPVLDLD